MPHHIICNNVNNFSSENNILLEEQFFFRPIIQDNMKFSG